MGRPFDTDGTRIRVRLGASERQLLARLLDEVGELLDDGSRPGGDPLAELVGFDLAFPDGPVPDGGLPDQLVPAPPAPEAPGLPSQPAAPAGEGGPADDRTTGPDDPEGPEHPADRTGTEPGGDPALARLLPSAHRDDPVLAAEFRRLTETGLRARKRSNLALASAALQRQGEVVLTREEASALLKGLTDTRLVLGERLDLRTDEDADRLAAVLRQRVGRDDPWVSAALLYDALTWWQESLVAALSQ